MERRERKNAVTVLAPAKLNLALDVVGLLPNGYHALDMTMQTITLYERVMLRRSAGLSLRLPGSLVQPNDKNTAIKAALAFFHYTGLLAGVDITIYKNTPVRAGMAGGSADAAAGTGSADHTGRRSSRAHSRRAAASPCAGGRTGTGHRRSRARLGAYRRGAYQKGEQKGGEESTGRSHSKRKIFPLAVYRRGTGNAGA